MTLNIPATRYTYQASISLSWRGVIGCVIREADAWLFCTRLGFRRYAYDDKGMLRHGQHSGIKGVVRFSRVVES